MVELAIITPHSPDELEFLETVLPIDHQWTVKVLRIAIQLTKESTKMAETGGRNRGKRPSKP
jgi:hypothetical protein